MSKAPKLIKDCEVGNTLYYAVLKDGSIEDRITPVSIVDIQRGSAWESDLYICKPSEESKVTYEFEHQDSVRHDSLIVDTDYAYAKSEDGHGHEYYKRFFTTYEAAAEWLMIEIKADIIKNLRRLESLESKNGVIDNIFQKKTYECKKNWYPYKKIVIYDCGSYERPYNIDRVLNGKKIKVYKQLIETDYYGSATYSGDEHFVKEFDCKEDALDFIFKNDKSRYHGKTDGWYEGYRYFIKIEEK